MRAEQYVIEHERSGQSRALAVVARVPHSRKVATASETASRQSRWAVQSAPLQPLRRVEVTGAHHGFKLPGRLSMAIGEVVEMLVATSGTLVVVVILLVMAMMLRAIRALLSR